MKQNCFLNCALLLLAGFICLAMAGCAGMEAVGAIGGLAADLNDAADPSVKFKGEVESVLFKPDTTVINFKGGISYEVKGHPDIQVGDTARIKDNGNGFEANWTSRNPSN